MAIRTQVIAELEATREAQAEAEREATRLAEEERLARQRTPLQAQQEREAQFARDRQHREERELIALRARYSRAFLATPGATPEQFDREWPGLLAQHRRDAMAGRDATPVDPLSDPKTWGLR